MRPRSVRLTALSLVPRPGTPRGPASKLPAYPRVETPTRISSSTRAVSGSRACYAATDGNTTSSPAVLRTRGRAIWMRRPPNVTSVAVRPQ